MLSTDKQVLSELGLGLFKPDGSVSYGQAGFQILPTAVIIVQGNNRPLAVVVLDMTVSG